MYIDLPIDEAIKLTEVKLCYIDNIPETYFDYTPEAKAYRETEEWKEQDRLRDEKLKKTGCVSSNDPEFGLNYNPILKRGAECQDYSNPVYIPGKQEYYAYFTPIPLEKQWGDDWDDEPYEYNAGSPYDDFFDENHVLQIVEIVRVPFYVMNDGWDVHFPKDWGGCNSSFTAQDINFGAVAWIYDRKTHTAINAGCTPKEFFEKLNKINSNRDEDV